MVTVEEAKRLLFAQAGLADPAEAELTDAFGCVIAEDIFSPIDLPSFNQSAMDGYAVASGDESERQFKVIGEIKAGDAGLASLQPGQAVRIYTGAAVPQSADAIVIQEKAEQVNGTIQLAGNFKKGDFIRWKGSQLKKGSLALRKGFVLNPAAIGLLAALGLSQIKIYKKPEVSVISTGDELISPGNTLAEGKIFESNSISLYALLRQMNITPKHIFTAGDDKKDLENKIETCLVDSDILILTGGISVGTYDLVHDILMQLRVEAIFWKVAQKPGKPMFAGKLGSKKIFALPGNPAAVIVCFYEYIYPVIRMMHGFKNITLPALTMKLAQDFVKKEDRALFARVKCSGDEAIPLEKHDSNMLLSFAEADALMYVPGKVERIKKGEPVEIHRLPFHDQY